MDWATHLVSLAIGLVSAGVGAYFGYVAGVRMAERTWRQQLDKERRELRDSAWFRLDLARREADRNREVALKLRELTLNEKHRELSFVAIQLDAAKTALADLAVLDTLPAATVALLGEYVAVARLVIRLHDSHTQISLQGAPPAGLHEKLRYNAAVLAASAQLLTETLLRTIDESRVLTDAYRAEVRAEEARLQALIAEIVDGDGDEPRVS